MQIERDRQADLQRQAEQQQEAEMARNLAWARERQQEAQQALEEEERQNMEAYQREVNHMHHQEELEAHTSSGSRSGNQAHSEAAAADYERDCHHENQLRREEEAEQHRQEEANQRSHNAANNIPPRALPKGRRPYHEPQGGPEHHCLGPMNVECNHCHALHFDSDKLSSSTRANKKFGSCCLQGQIQLPAFREPPRTLREMLCGISPYSKSFKKNIRQYNAAFAFASLGVKVDHAVTNAPGAYCFCINGELHHLSGALLPEIGQPEKYAQIYIHDPAIQLGMRQRTNANLDPIIMTNLQAMLHETHPYVLLYKQAFHIMHERPPDEQQDVAVQHCAERNQDLCRYNLPNANEEIAAIIPGDGSEEQSNHRDIVLHLSGGGLQRISHLHPSYSSLHYVLLFPYGEDGWHTDIPAQPGPQGQ
jgi:hypothetical protein